jgi:6-phosphogluconolactonase
MRHLPTLISTIVYSLALQTFLVGVLASQRSSAQQPQSETFPFLIGGYGEGLYLSSLDTKQPAIAEPKLLIKLDRASFFCQHPSRPMWYCVSEAGRGDGKSGPVLTSLKASVPAGSLEIVNQEDVKGNGPCYVTTDAKGEFAIVANYGDGSVTMFPIKADGALAPASDFIKHAGKSTNPHRQGEPHAHCAVVDPTDRFVLVNDLGIDQVVVYEIDRTNKKLLAKPERNLAMPAGSGPRHLAFHPTHDIYYVINELLCTIAVVRWDQANGMSKVEQIVPTLPGDFKGDNTTAEILVHPSGKYVFGSNRGHDSIASFAISPDDGHLQLVGHCKTGGKTPRNFRIDPTGNFILAENQQSNSIYILKLDEKTGELTNTDQHVSVPGPACIKFIR